MKTTFDFIVANWVTISSILLGISELMALNPKWKASGILDFIIKSLKK